jgi:hypothetical protein
MSLRCEEVRDRFSALWEKELDPSEEAEVRSHVELCPECEREYARFDRTLRMLHSVEEVDVPEGFLTEIHKKIEEREGGRGFSDKAPWGWFPLPLPWKLPVQALAMVAIVFLALYLTQRVPEESLQKVTNERQAAVSEEKKSEGEVKTPQAVDQMVANRVIAKKEDMKDAPQAPKEEAPVGKAGKDSRTVAAESSRGGTVPRPPAVPSPQAVLRPQAERSASKPLHREMEEKEITKRPDETAGDEKAYGQPKGIIPREPPRLKEAEPTRPSLLKMKTSEGTGETIDAGSPGPKPLEEIVLKTPDPKETVSQVQALVKQFSGETLTTEGNTFLISLPSSSLPEFRRHLEEVKAPMRKREAPPLKERGVGSVAESLPKRRDAGKKEKDTSRPDAVKEIRTIIRIVVEGE